MLTRRDLFRRTIGAMIVGALPLPVRKVATVDLRTDLVAFANRYYTIYSTPAGPEHSWFREQFVRERQFVVLPTYKGF